MLLLDLGVATTTVVRRVHVPGVRNIGVAVALAVLSTACYATSAVLQERESAGHDAHGMRLMARLVHRPWWWLAVAATGVGALLHIAALASGPLSLVQPLGVLTLVLALPLGARLGGHVVGRTQWRAAAAVVLGLVAVLAVVPHHARPADLAPSVLLTAAVAVAAAVGCVMALASRISGRGAPVMQAAGAATLFGFASAMARAAVTSADPAWLAAALATAGAVSGLCLAQLAYRSGGLGAPLATQILVDPIVAVLLGVTLLGEPLQLSPLLVVVGIAGLAATATGIWALTRPSQSAGPREAPPITPARRGGWPVVRQHRPVHPATPPPPDTVIPLPNQRGPGRER